MMCKQKGRTKMGLYWKLFFNQEEKTKIAVQNRHLSIHRHGRKCEGKITRIGK